MFEVVWGWGRGRGVREERVLYYPRVPSWLFKSIVISHLLWVLDTGRVEGGAMWAMGFCFQIQKLPRRLGVA